MVRIVGDFVKTNSSADVVKTYSMVIANFSNYWKNNQYDCLIALGDRFEMSAAIQSTIPFHIPVAHIHGGETPRAMIISTDIKFPWDPNYISLQQRLIAIELLELLEQTKIFLM